MGTRANVSLSGTIPDFSALELFGVKGTGWKLFIDQKAGSRVYLLGIT